MRFSNFCQRLLVYIKIYLLLLVVFLIFRFLFLFSYGNLSDIFLNYKYDLQKAFWQGFRCDTVVLCYMLIPLFALNLLSFACFNHKWISKYDRFLYVFTCIYSTLLFVVIYWINIIDYFYYRNFQSHFDSRLFGIVEDGTKNVMSSVWSDYPTITVFLVFLVFLYVWIKIIRWVLVSRKTQNKITQPLVQIGIVILSLGLLFLGARGSVTIFPFNKNDLQFSVNLFVNDVAPNGVFCLKRTLVDRAKNGANINTKVLLQDYGYSSLEDAKKDWETANLDDTTTLFAQKTTLIDSFLENNPPNVVLIIMEGWSSDFFRFHSADLNLLGHLETQLPGLIHYPYCFPVNLGTIAALETFITNNIGESLSASQYSLDTLETSTAIAFQKAGYEASFYTSGYTGWRNLGSYCRTQGFDNVCGAEYIQTIYPKAETQDWGVFDEYLFPSIKRKLQEKTSKPQFLLCLTITNHSPHKTPTTYHPYPLQIPDSLENRMSVSEDQTLDIFETFQYANDCLGKFIDSIRHSPLGKNTIIVATGDHAMTSSLTYSDSELLYHYSTPLVFYIPDEYRKEKIIDTGRLVSHADVLPTVYNIALSDYSYPATGNNVFDSTTIDDSFVVTKSSWVIGNAGCVNLESDQTYSWLTSGSYLLEPNATNTVEIEQMKRKAKAWLFGMKWQIYSELDE